MPITVCHTG